MLTARANTGTARGGWWRAAAAGAAVLAAAGCGASGTTAGPASRSPALRGSASAAAGTSSPVPTAAPTPTGPPRTSCHSVVHIGDSTSDGLVLPAYQPRARLRIPAQYRRVGVARFIDRVSGARSIVETWHGFPNGYTVARALLRGGYHGCWVIALGTNDSADVQVGSAVGLAARIRRMMKLIGSQPVLWVNVVSLLSSGPYANQGMRQWDRALLRACPSYPTMRVYNWAAVARRSWFVPDGIHYTPHGYARRSRLIANALARAFPAGMAVAAPAGQSSAAAGTSPSCQVP